MPVLTSSRPQWDIFCAVVDNYGDIGVCWRLSRQLAAEHGIAVRLWVDDLKPFARLCPAVDVTVSAQTQEGVEIRHWDKSFPDVQPGVVVIEAFACTLPPAFLAAMAAQPTPPVWLNVEYLSAEDWVRGCHGLPSPHPSLPLTKYFFFPGFSEGTGGVLGEAGLESARAAFVADARAQQAWFAAQGLAPAAPDALTVSLFSYGGKRINALLAVWEASAQPIHVWLPEGRGVAEASAWAGQPLSPCQPFQRGALTCVVLPFLPQPDYDRLLWLCDVNFVRGEDSFVRAQWAARPFVWHIYPQDDNVHMGKLSAFLDRYSEGCTPATSEALFTFWHNWNHGIGLADGWRTLLPVLPALNQHAADWATQLGQRAGLAANLVRFCKNLL